MAIARARAEARERDLSAIGRAVLVAREGRRLTAYRDAVGIATIGIGCTRIDGRPVRMGDAITGAECDALFETTVARYVAAVNRGLEVAVSQNAFDALVIPPARKRLLEALIKQQQTHKTEANLDDVIQGKGQGLIMLLAGPPGTGKTLTAESIADRLQLPLYAISPSELGDIAKDIENHFGQVLRLAASWNAVLLLDEADAFLERRVDTSEARERNKRVAGGLLHHN